MNGPLGASCGGDNGSTLLMTVSEVSLPAANAVNDGARRGLRLLRCNCKTNEGAESKDGFNSNDMVIRVATFASRLWRTINGETWHASSLGVCAHDAHLRCSLVALWEWIWPKYCMQLMRCQSWHVMQGKAGSKDLMGSNPIMKTTEEEKEAGAQEDRVLAPLVRAVQAEVDRQKWRGEMAKEMYKCSHKEGANLMDVGQPLPVLKKDPAWKLGGWVASTAHQRRKEGADGGSAVSKIRLM